jgi:hypothetical protein
MNTYHNTLVPSVNYYKVGFNYTKIPLSNSNNKIKTLNYTINPIYLDTVVKVAVNGKIPESTSDNKKHWEEQANIQSRNDQRAYLNTTYSNNYTNLNKENKGSPSTGNYGNVYYLNINNLVYKYKIPPKDFSTKLYVKHRTSNIFYQLVPSLKENSYNKFFWRITKQNATSYTHYVTLNIGTTLRITNTNSNVEVSTKLNLLKLSLA